MATVTGLTAERMAEIEAQSIVDGEIVGDNLILKRFDDATIDAGSVRGPQGIQGPIGEVSQAELDAAIEALETSIESQILAAVPAGVPLDYVGTVAPPGFLLMEGQAVIDADTLYPVLWSRVPAGWKSGTTLNMPDTRGRVSVSRNPSDTDFDTVGEVGGAKTVTLTIGHMPNHGHPVTSVGPESTAHIHPVNIVSTANGAHDHNVQRSGGGGFDNYVDQDGTFTLTQPFDGPVQPNHQHDVTGNTSTESVPHNHLVTLGNTGGDAAHNNVQPFIVFVKIIRAY